MRIVIWMHFCYSSIVKDEPILLEILTRQQNIASRHPRLSGIGRHNKLNSKKDSGQAGMTELGYLLAGLIVQEIPSDIMNSFDRHIKFR
jgi:hypothetical protein